MFIKPSIIKKVFNIDVEKALLVYLWTYSKHEYHRIKTISFINSRIIGTFRKSLFSRPVLAIPKNTSHYIFYIRTYTRSDLDEHSNVYESACTNTLVCSLFNRERTLDACSLLKAFLVLLAKQSELLESLHSHQISLRSQKGLCILLTLLDALSESFKILPCISRSSKLVSFQEMVPAENILCQIANSFKIPTYSLQHSIGAYNGVYSSKSSLTNPPHFMSSVCKNILVWGDYTKRCFKRFTDSEIHCIGKPVLPQANSYASGITFIYDSDDEFNNHLLEYSVIMKKKGFQVSNWFKPGHKLVMDGVVRDGPLRKIIIGMKSTLLFEIGYLGGHVFVLPESIVADDLPNSLIIHSPDEMELRYYNLISYPHYIWKDFINCTAHESVNRYREIICGTRAYH
jgi:hypothetical protein